MKLVIDIDENVFTRLFDNGTEDYAIVNDDLFKIAKSIRNGKPLPSNPTNGDMIKALFPDAKVNVAKYSYVIEVKLPYHTEYDTGLLCDRGWWNTPYKEEDEDGR